MKLTKAIEEFWKWDAKNTSAGLNFTEMDKVLKITAPIIRKLQIKVNVLEQGLYEVAHCDSSTPCSICGEQVARALAEAKRIENE